jgi:ABC-2 type transport system ATP-binding protein
MRILAGFFPATEGTAEVAGFDVFTQPLEAKSRVGYLPESPPVYMEMTVDSYLRFVARIKGVKGSEISSRVNYVKKRCGLLEEGDRLIQHLSKGYRQRVGLAQALVHNPEVLILDEPTIGLDPKQIREVRGLIKSLAGDHTVILSTHILPEVSMTCERVIIINNGKIVAVDTPENLTRQLSGGQRIEIEIAGPIERLPQVINSIPLVKPEGPPKTVNGTHRLRLISEGQEEVRHLISRRCIEAGYDLYGLQSEGMTLEEVFLKLTTTEEETE